MLIISVHSPEHLFEVSEAVSNAVCLKHFKAYLVYSFHLVKHTLLSCTANIEALYPACGLPCGYQSQLIKNNMVDLNSDASQIYKKKVLLEIISKLLKCGS